MSITVYVIVSIKDKTFYTGITNNFNRRIHDHNSGHNCFTKSRRPYKLLFREEYPDYKTARKREKYLKSGIGRELIHKQAGIV